ncbi:MAG: hypothetical protein Q8R37_01435 [Nanoarchaeota archaeon]|nr:hypothetical protein [Nanoarchaeota archaeon]
MNKSLYHLITTVQKNRSDNSSWIVLADYLLGKGDQRGELIAIDLALRNGLDSAEARQTLRDGREKVCKEYGLDKVPDYLLQDKFWKGSFPLHFPNGKEKLKELDGAFAEEFPRSELLPIANNYAQGVHALQEACEQEKSITHPTFVIDDKKVYRPLTFKENIQARVEDFYTLYDESGKKRNMKQRLRLFNTFLDSCAGIAYKANSSEFKLILQSPHLIGINEDFNDELLPIDYNSLHGDGVIPLNRNDGTYNQVLTQEQVLAQPAWNAAVEEDKPLLQEHTDIIFSQRKGNNMGFWLRNEINEDHLRALFVSDLYDYSNADGYGYLNSNGCFLRR